MEKLHLSDDQMRTFWGDYGSGRPGEKVGVAGTTNTHVLGKGRPKRNLTTRGRLGQNTPILNTAVDR